MSKVDDPRIRGDDTGSEGGKRSVGAGASVALAGY